MASSRGNQPYQMQLEHALYQPSYHSDTICGSSFFGLTTTLERLASENRVNDGIEQIRKCIRARLAEMQRRAFPDPVHNNVITKLNSLLQKYGELRNLTPAQLKGVGVSYSDISNTFTFTLFAQPLKLGGKKMKKRKSKTIKSRKTIKNRKTIKRIKTRRMKKQ